MKRALVVVAVVLLAGCNDGDLPADAGFLCDPGLKACGDRCVQLSIDPFNCGACGNACAANAVCNAGLCEPVCRIDGGVVGAGTMNPEESCQRCEPASSSTGWTPKADGTGCGDGGLCGAGLCTTDCFIDGMRYVDGAGNPDNACEQCSHSSANGAWSPVSDGTSCAEGEICQAGACTAKCFIDGMVVSAGDANPSNACQRCNPMLSTSAWSFRTDGVSCGTGQVCQTGTCQPRCFIGGAFYAEGDVNPGNACEQCLLSASATAWTAFDDGTACGSGLMCATGECGVHCFIDAQVRDAGETGSDCQFCDPAQAVDAWSASADDTACDGGFCGAGACEARCIIDGGHYDAGAINGADLCLACDPSRATSDWSGLAEAVLLEGGIDPAAQGWTVLQLAPATIDLDGGVTTLSTTTVSGGRTGGQLLLARPATYTPGQPFHLKVRAEVLAVNTHNQLDCGATIMPSLTGSVGNSTERAQMVCMDPTNMVFGDNAQPTPFQNIDAGVHVYELNVDDAGVLNVIVDGTQLMSRSGFVGNGTIAVGDQTNDPNTDGITQVHRVTRVCQ